MTAYSSSSPLLDLADSSTSDHQQTSPPKQDNPFSEPKDLLQSSGKESLLATRDLLMEAKPAADESIKEDLISEPTKKVSDSEKPSEAVKRLFV